MSNHLDKLHYDPQVCFAFEQIAITNGGATAFTAATIANAKLAIVTVELANMRERHDGTAPTTTVGTLYGDTNQFQIYGSENLKNFKAIATTGTGVTLDCEYYR